MSNGSRITPLRSISSFPHADLSLALLAPDRTPCVLYQMKDTGAGALDGVAREVAQRLIALEHGNVARTLGIETHAGGLVTVIEYIRGGTLADVLGVCRPLGLAFTPAMGAFVAREATRGLAHLKAPFGALSPETIMISVEGEVKLVDLAAMLSTALGGEPWNGAGRARFSAPEVRRTAQPTAAGDVYSLGMILKDALDWLDKAADIKPELREIVNQCSLDQPEGRPTPGDLDRSLTAYLTREHPDFIPRKMGTFIESMLADAIDTRAGLIRDAVARGLDEREIRGHPTDPDLQQIGISRVSPDPAKVAPAPPQPAGRPFKAAVIGMREARVAPPKKTGNRTLYLALAVGLAVLTLFALLHHHHGR